MFPWQPPANGLSTPSMEAAGIEPAQDSPGTYNYVEWFYECVAARANEMFDGRLTTLYFIADDAARAVKIGITDNVAARLRSLQAGNPNDLLVLASTPATAAIERLIHSILLKQRIHGEWFRMTEDVLALAEELADLSFGMRLLGDDLAMAVLRARVLERASA